MKGGPTLLRNRVRHKESVSFGWLGCILAVALALAIPGHADAAASTSLTVSRLASDGRTVLAQQTVDLQWLMDPQNIPTLGDGTTHYYHQGPVFVDAPDDAAEQKLRWNLAEDTNIRDMGAVKGTNVKDLCALVGGMAPGDTLKIKANDGFSRTFAYKNVYSYSQREGPMVICWYRDGSLPGDGFSDGMRLVWFADGSTNPWQQNIFGNWDWHQAAEERYWYYFQSGGEKYPTTSGLSIQRVSELIIYSNQAPPATAKAPVADFAADRITGTVPITVQFQDRSINSPVEWQWDFDNDGRLDSSAQNPTHTYSNPGVYSVSLTVRNRAGSDEVVKLNWIQVDAATVPEPEPDPPAPQRPSYWGYALLLAGAVTIAALGAISVRRHTRRD